MKRFLNVFELTIFVSFLLILSPFVNADGSGAAAGGGIGGLVFLCCIGGIVVFVVVVIIILCCGGGAGGAAAAGAGAKAAQSSNTRSSGTDKALSTTAKVAGEILKDDDLRDAVVETAADAMQNIAGGGDVESAMQDAINSGFGFFG